MIRLNTWHQETSTKDERQQRLSDHMPDHHEAYDASRLPEIDRRVQCGALTESGLAQLAAKLTKRHVVQDLQFWTDFQAYLKDSVPERCLYIKVMQPSTALTSDLLLVQVLDEFECPSMLYLSLQWMRAQAARLDRPVHLALKGRPIDRPLAPEDVLLIYDYVRSGDSIIADKFHF